MMPCELISVPRLASKQITFEYPSHRGSNPDFQQTNVYAKSWASHDLRQELTNEAHWPNLACGLFCK